MNSNINLAFVSRLFVIAGVVVAMSAMVSVVHADEYGDVGGFDGYSDVGGYDGGYGDVGGYEGYSDVGGCTDACGDSGYSDVGGYNGTDMCGCDTNGDGVVTVDEWEEHYSSASPSWGGSSSMGGFGGTSMARGMSYGYSVPMTFYAPSTPVYHAPTPTYMPPAVTNNNCVNNSCNTTNTTNIVNSGNTTVYPVQAEPIQYQASYIQPTYVRPYCTITISYNTNAAYGPYANQLATLTWTSSNATSGYISPMVGTVSGYGTMTVYPTNGQVYTMTVYGQGGTATCQTTAYYAPVYQAPVNPTPYVSLSQIPYTGFDFGTLGNALYWLSLVAFAGAAAYLVLYFQGGALAILGTRANRVQAATPKITVSKAPAYVSTPAPVHAEAPVVSPIQIAHAPASKTTSDSMQVKHSKAGEAPRIVISRE